MVGLVSSMVMLSEPIFDRVGVDLLGRFCVMVLADALATLPALYFSVLPSLSVTDSCVTDTQASFAKGVCEAEASGRGYGDACLASALASRADDVIAPEEQTLAYAKVHDEAMEGLDPTDRIGQKDISAWIYLAKNKDDDEEDNDDEDDDDEEDDDEGADEENAADEGEGEEEVEGHSDDGGGDDEDEDDVNDDENGKGDDEEDEEVGVEAEDDEDEDAAEDEEDDEDDDDEPQEPPQKKRK